MLTKRFRTGPPTVSLEGKDPIIEEAEAIEKRAQAIINNIAKPLYGIATTSNFAPDCLQKVTQDYNEATIFSIKVSKNVVEIDPAVESLKTPDQRLKPITANFKELVAQTETLMKSYIKCANEVQKKRRKIYDPIDLIGETINFYITASGSITPTWKLARLTAPLSPTFASASRKDTNTLILSMGRPVPTPEGGITASQAMNNQILAAQLAQAFNQRPAP